VKKIADDLPDALRYLLMSVAPPNLHSVVVGARSTRDLSRIPEGQRWVYERLRVTEARGDGSGIIGWDDFFARDSSTELYDPNSSGIIGASPLDVETFGFPSRGHEPVDSFW
jgi:hypothetical protein